MIAMRTVASMRTALSGLLVVGLVALSVALGGEPVFDGLRPVGPGETAYYSVPVGLVPEPEPSNDESVNDPLELNRLRPAPLVMKSCLRCHGGPGTGAIQSFYVGHFQDFPLYATDQASQVSRALDATRKTHAWGLLEGLWETLAPGQP
jgi:hypothetical protein